MNLTLTTYIDNKKFLIEKYSCDYLELNNISEIRYNDKKGKNLIIVIDKNKYSVSIIKDNIKMLLKKERSFTSYATNYGVIDLETKLLKIVKLEKNNFIQYELEYEVYYGKIDSQNNKLKILIKKS